MWNSLTLCGPCWSLRREKPSLSQLRMGQVTVKDLLPVGTSQVPQEVCLQFQSSSLSVTSGPCLQNAHPAVLGQPAGTWASHRPQRACLMIYKVAALQSEIQGSNPSSRLPSEACDWLKSFTLSEAQCCRKTRSICLCIFSAWNIHFH